MEAFSLKTTHVQYVVSRHFGVCKVLKTVYRMFLFFFLFYTETAATLHPSDFKNSFLFFFSEYNHMLYTVADDNANNANKTVC